MPRPIDNNELKIALRKERAIKCFPVINRGKFWYECLTDEQVVELKNWYWAWLNVTETLIIPVEPEWLNNKLTKEEIII